MGKSLNQLLLSPLDFFSGEITPSRGRPSGEMQDARHESFKGKNRGVGVIGFFIYGNENLRKNKNMNDWLKEINDL